MGTGTYEEALAWVEYCNGTGNTQSVVQPYSVWARGMCIDTRSWANLRRKNTGRDEPHNVKYWGLGNEGGSSAWLTSDESTDQQCGVLGRSATSEQQTMQRKHGNGLMV